MARSRFRSVRYDLAASLEVARLADSAGGSIAPDLLAPALGYSGTNNGAYLSRVASARLFGVVTGRGGRLELTRGAAGSWPEWSLRPRVPGEMRSSPFPCFGPWPMRRDRTVDTFPTISPVCSSTNSGRWRTRPGRPRTSSWRLPAKRG